MIFKPVRTVAKYVAHSDEYGRVIEFGEEHFFSFGQPHNYEPHMYRVTVEIVEDILKVGQAWESRDDKSWVFITDLNMYKMRLTYVNISTRKFEDLDLDTFESKFTLIQDVVEVAK